MSPDFSKWGPVHSEFEIHNRQGEIKVPIWLYEGKLETQTLTWLATGYTKGWMLSVHVTWLCSGLDHDGQRILSHNKGWKYPESLLC